MPKYFFSKNNFEKDSVVLHNETAHHIIHVLRMKAGAQVTLCDGNDTDYTATLRETDAKHGVCRFTLTEPVECKTETPVPVTLYQSLPKGDKMEIVIQKSVELGVHKIVPLYTAHSLVRDAEKKTVRYQRVAQSAAEQSMRGIVPEVSPPRTLAEALKEKESTSLSLAALSPGEVTNFGGNSPEVCFTPLRDIFTPALPDRISLWIGPEGGFSSEEIALLLESGAKAISLGARVLRTETAALAALAQINLITE